MDTSLLRRYLFRSVVCLSGTTAMAGCATNNHAQNGALVGGGLGAGLGAIAGSHNGDSAAGAIIGGTLGALGGGLIGSNQDAWEQRDAAINQMVASSQPMYPPLTNHDLIRMSQSGLGDEVIINAVQSRGGQFQLNPDGLIALKSNGVSDQVIQYVQTNGGPPPSSTAIAPPPEVIFVQPRPVVDVHLGPPPIYFDHHHHHGRRRPRSGFAFSTYHRF